MANFNLHEGQCCWSDTELPHLGMWPHNLLELWTLCQCHLLVLILPLKFYWFILTLLDQLTENNIKRCRQLIEYNWWFSCQVHHFHWYLMPYGVFWRKQVLSINVGHIVVVLALDDVAVQYLLSHNMAFIYPHNICCPYNLFSIRGNYNPPNLLRLHSDFWESPEDGLHLIYWNIFTPKPFTHRQMFVLVRWTHNPVVNGTG